MTDKEAPGSSLYQIDRVPVQEQTGHQNLEL